MIVLNTAKQLWNNNLVNFFSVFRWLKKNSNEKNTIRKKIKKTSLRFINTSIIYKLYNLWIYKTTIVGWLKIEL